MESVSSPRYQTPDLRCSGPRNWLTGLTLHAGASDGSERLRRPGAGLATITVAHDDGAAGRTDPHLVESPAQPPDQLEAVDVLNDEYSFCDDNGQRYVGVITRPTGWFRRPEYGYSLRPEGAPDISNASSRRPSGHDRAKHLVRRPTSHTLPPRGPTPCWNAPAIVRVGADGRAWDDGA